MTESIVVPDDADEFFDVDYKAVEDTEHGEEELGDVPSELVEND